MTLAVNMAYNFELSVPVKFVFKYLDMEIFRNFLQQIVDIN